MKKKSIVIPLLGCLFSGGLMVRTVFADEVLVSNEIPVENNTVETVLPIEEKPSAKKEVIIPNGEIVPETTVETTISTTVEETTSKEDVVVPDFPIETTVSTTVEKVTTQETSQTTTVVEDVVVSPDNVVLVSTTSERKVEKVSVNEDTTVYEKEKVNEEGELKVLPNTGTSQSSLAWLGLIPLIGSIFILKENKKEGI